MMNKQNKGTEYQSEDYGDLVLYLILKTPVLLLKSIPVWLLWNALMPQTFGLCRIDYLQAFGLTFLVYFLFFL